MTTDSRNLPRPGETWGPQLPWPTEAVPVGMYTHGLGTLTRAGRQAQSGYTFAIIGWTDTRFTDEPTRQRQAVRSAWEYRYGDMVIWDRNGGELPDEASVNSPGRYGSGAVIIDEVGATTVWAHRPAGARLTLSLRDMRIGWGPVDQGP